MLHGRRLTKYKMKVLVVADIYNRGLVVISTPNEIKHASQCW